MNARLVLVTLLLAGARVALSGSLSSLSVEQPLDNNECPRPIVAADGGTVVLAVAGVWMPSGECALYVDDVLVAQSDGPAVTYELSGSATGWKSYRLSLVSGGKTINKVLTFFPSPDFTCTLHTAETNPRFLDARPGDTVRKIRPAEIAEITWSGLWNATADQSVVRLYAGRDASGDCLKELVNVQGLDEGVCPLRPDDEAMNAGSIYTLTHFDGVETLTAHFGIRGGAVLILR